MTAFFNGTKRQRLQQQHDDALSRADVFLDEKKHPKPNWKHKQNDEKEEHNERSSTEAVQLRIGDKI